ncbi:MAG TPA: hypothetical protein VGF77_10835 [Allosphingosinicella sp.]|jgi:hypothetical protein
MHAVPSVFASLAGLLLCLLDPAAASAQVPPDAQGKPIARPIKSLRTLLVPDLSQPRQRLVFERRGKDLCGPGYTLQTVRSPSDLAADTFVSQSVPPGSRVTCAKVVSVTLASPQQPASTGDKNIGGKIPVPPPQFAVGDLNDSEALGLLRQRSQALCKASATVEQRGRQSAETPAGGYDGQSPAPDTIYTCNMTLIVWRSLGPAPVGPPPVSSSGRHKRITIGLLSSQAAIDRLSGLVLGACDQPLSLSQEPRSSDSPKGDYLDQSPAAGSIYACGEPVAVFVSSGPATPDWYYAAAGAAALAILLLLVKLARAVPGWIKPPVYGLVAERARLRARVESGIPVEHSISVRAGPGRLRARSLDPIRGIIVRGE